MAWIPPHLRQRLSATAPEPTAPCASDTLQHGDPPLTADEETSGQKTPQTRESNESGADLCAPANTPEERSEPAVSAGADLNPPHSQHCQTSSELELKIKADKVLSAQIHTSTESLAGSKADDSSNKVASDQARSSTESQSGSKSDAYPKKVTPSQANSTASAPCIEPATSEPATKALRRFSPTAAPFQPATALAESSHNRKDAIAKSTTIEISNLTLDPVRVYLESVVQAAPVGTPILTVFTKLGSLNNPFGQVLASVKKTVDDKSTSTSAGESSVRIKEYHSNAKTSGSSNHSVSIAPKPPPSEDMGARGAGRRRNRGGKAQDILPLADTSLNPPVEVSSTTAKSGDVVRRQGRGGQRGGGRSTQVVRSNTTTPSSQHLTNTPFKEIPLEEAAGRRDQNVRRGRGGYAHRGKAIGRENENPTEETKGRTKFGKEIQTGEPSCYTPAAFYGTLNGIGKRAEEVGIAEWQAQYQLRHSGEKVLQEQIQTPHQSDGGNVFQNEPNSVLFNSNANSETSTSLDSTRGGNHSSNSKPHQPKAKMTELEREVETERRRKERWARPKKVMVDDRSQVGSHDTAVLAPGQNDDDWGVPLEPDAPIFSDAGWTPNFLEPERKLFIQAWLENMRASKMTTLINGDALVQKSDREAAPRQWAVYRKIEGKLLDEFWSEYASTSPPPLDFELLDRRPWWQKWVRESSAFLEPVDYPEAKLDPTDKFYLAGRSSKNVNDEIKGFYAKIEQAKLEQKQIKKDRALEMRPYPVPNLPRPQANIYLRLACEGDVPHIADIYNHYVRFAWVSPERDVVADDDMADRFVNIKNLNLPWIVAVERGNNIQKVQLFSPGKWAGREKIMGYAFADDTNSATGAMRYTAEIEVYVHKDHRNRGIGKALLDRLLYTMENSPKMQTACPWYCEDLFKEAGNARSMHRLIMNVMYAPNDENDRIRCLWIRAWLERFGFKVCGELDEVGCRMANSLNIMTFIRKCPSNRIDIRSANQH